MHKRYIMTFLFIGLGFVSLSYQNCSSGSGLYSGIGESSPTPRPPGTGGFRVPDESGTIRQLAENYENDFELSCQAQTRGSWSFLHRVVTTLHEKDARWGYFFKNCSSQRSFEAFAKGHRHSIAYFIGDADDVGEGSSEVIPVRILRNHCNSSEQVEVTWRGSSSKGCWTYPWENCQQPPTHFEWFVRDFPDNYNVSFEEQVNYIDRLIVELNRQGPFQSWGYLCKGGNCNNIAEKRVAYGCRPNQGGSQPWEEVIPVYVINDDGDDSDWAPRAVHSSSWWSATRSGGSPGSGSPNPSPSPSPSPSASPSPSLPSCWQYTSRSTCSARTPHCKWFTAGSKCGMSWAQGCYPSCGALGGWRECSLVQSTQGACGNQQTSGMSSVAHKLSEYTYEELDSLKTRAARGCSTRVRCCGSGCTKTLPARP